ncbi:MAG: DNA-3-methyladenine glycosylase family protein [Candidatus Kariarchaeaceae archaeon]
MVQKKFYMINTGENVIKKDHLIKFTIDNPELSEYIGNYLIELKPINLPEFQVLTYWIIGQVISNKVAHKIINEFREKVNTITPENIAQMDDIRLTRLVNSRSKAMYIKNLAKFFLNGNYLEPEGKSSYEIIEHYSNIKGIGAWTVKMLLIYSYGRLDVLALEDLGVRKGIQIMYNTTKVPTISEAKKLTINWKNLPTIGTLLSWKVLID